MNPVDKYLPTALQAVADPENGLYENGRIKRVYKGYVSAFGTIVKQSGLLPAAVLYGKQVGDSENNKRADGNKTLITDLLHRILQPQLNYSEQNFLDFAFRHKDDFTVRREVLRAAVALKLALRTQKFTENE